MAAKSVQTAAVHKSDDAISRERPGCRTAQCVHRRLDDSHGGGGGGSGGGGGKREASVVDGRGAACWKPKGAACLCGETVGWSREPSEAAEAESYRTLCLPRVTPLLIICAQIPRQLRYIRLVRVRVRTRADPSRTNIVQRRRVADPKSGTYTSHSSGTHAVSTSASSYPDIAGGG
jgi:hypothetical protein